jgi:hypothetical protein
LAESSPLRRTLGDRPRVIDRTFEAHTTLHRAVLSLFGLQPPAHVREADTHAVPLPELVDLSEDRDVFGETYHLKADAYEAMLVAGGHKLHMFARLDDDVRLRPKGRVFQLFDVRADPKDAQDLYARHAKEVAPLRKRLERRAGQVVGVRPDARRDIALSDEEKERLRALGYAR